MGQEPIVDKTSELGSCSYFSFGSSCMQGQRSFMEDRQSHVMEKDVFNTKDKKDTEVKMKIMKRTGEKKKEEKNENLKCGTRYSFFGVYDGHSGYEAAEFCAQNLIKYVEKTEKQRILELHSSQNKLEVNEEEKKEEEKNQTPISELFANDKSIQDSFLNFDQEFRKVAENQNMAGCTCVSCFIVPDPLVPKQVEVVCCNVGDSRGIIYNRGEVVALSMDHKPGNDIEFERIKNAGGFVQYGRVNGNLALSRAFGDYQFKKNLELPLDKQVVVALPDIKRYKFTLEKKNDKREVEKFVFVVLACDGVWDVMENKTVADYVVSLMKLQDEGIDKYLAKRAAKMKDLYQDLEDKPDIKQLNEKAKKEMLALKKRGYRFFMKQIAEDLLDHAVLKLGSKDNCSACVVIFDN